MVIHNLKNKLMLKTQQTKATSTPTKKNGSPSHTTVHLYTRSLIYLNALIERSLSNYQYFIQPPL